MIKIEKNGLYTNRNLNGKPFYLGIVAQKSLKKRLISVAKKTQRSMSAVVRHALDAGIAQLEQDIKDNACSKCGRT